MTAAAAATVVAAAARKVEKRIYYRKMMSNNGDTMLSISLPPHRPIHSHTQFDNGNIVGRFILCDIYAKIMPEGATK